MPTLVHKVQVLLTDEQYRLLLKLAKAQRKPLSVLLREGVVEHSSRKPDGRPSGRPAMRSRQWRSPSENGRRWKQRLHGHTPAVGGGREVLLGHQHLHVGRGRILTSALTIAWV